MTMVDWAGRAVGHGHDQRVRAPAAVVATVARRSWCGPTSRSGPTVTSARSNSAQVTVVDIHNLADRGAALRRRRHAASRRSRRRRRRGARKPAAVRRARRAEQVRARARAEPDQGAPARHRRARPQPRHHPRSARSRPRARSSAASSPTRRSASRAGSTRPRRCARSTASSPPRTASGRAIAKPGTMFVSQPEIPVPLVAEFPFPAWATRPDEVGTGGVRPGRSASGANGAADGNGSGEAAARRAGRRPVRRPAGHMKILHTSDWHVGKTIRGAVPARRAPAGPGRDHRRRARPSRRPRPRGRRPLRVGGAVGRRRAGSCSRALLDLHDTGAKVVVIAGNHDNPGRFEAIRPVMAELGITVLGHVARPDDGGVLEHTTGGRRARAPRAAAVLLAALLDPRRRADEPGGRTRTSGSTPSGCARILAALTADFDGDAVNLVVAHGMVRGGKVGGGERDAQTSHEDYWLDASAFPLDRDLRRARPPPPRAAAARRPADLVLGLADPGGLRRGRRGQARPGRRGRAREARRRSSRSR